MSSFGCGMISSYQKEGVLMTVRQYRVYLGWSISELARRAGTTAKTIRRIEAGLPVNDYTVGPAARAFSEALGRQITIYDLEGVSIRET
jgi:transcriptional regulator with XRE-family HTH domain